MKRFALPLMVTFAVLALVAFPTRRAAADDETSDTEIKIHAPLTGFDCTANTITVLGLTIDVSNAAIDAGNSDGEDQGGDGDDNEDDQGGDDTGGDNGDGDNGDDDSGTNGGPSGCAALVSGQPVDVKLASDGTPLVATEVSQGGRR